MTLIERISALATAIGTQIKNLKASVGNLANLATTAKGDLVSAINEVHAAAGSAGAQINDTTASGTTTYSSSKIEQVATDAALNVKNQLLNGASAAYDTFIELEQSMNANTSSTQALVTAVGNRVRFDDVQTLTTQQKTQACANIGVGEPDTDFVATFNAALV